MTFTWKKEEKAGMGKREREGDAASGIRNEPSFFSFLFLTFSNGNVLWLFLLLLPPHSSLRASQVEKKGEAEGKKEDREEVARADSAQIREPIFISH